MKNAIVLGTGISAKSAIKVLLDNDYRVYVYDDYIKNIENIPSDLAGDRIDFIFNKEDIIKREYEIAMKSPGIKPDNEAVKLLENNGYEIFSDIELGYRFKGDIKIIAVTGTNGKSTTTALIDYLLNFSNIKSQAVGNIGVGAAESLENSDSEYLVIECSSYQLDDIITFRPDISIITNVTSDHLDYHKNIENYQNAKFKIFKNQKVGDFLIINLDDENLDEITSNSTKLTVSLYNKNANYFSDGDFIFENGEKLIELKDFKLIGNHNLYNAMFATAVGRILKIETSKIEDVLSNFNGLAHRLEFVKTIDGVDYFNDSKATNVESTITAVNSFNNNLILIVGGSDKGEDYTELLKISREKVKSFIVMGATKKDIIKTMKSLKISNFIEAASLKDAVYQAKEIATSGDTILLSPACASFDSFKNFEERGENFKEIINSI